MRLLHAHHRPDLHSWLRAAWDSYIGELVAFGAAYERVGGRWEPDYLPYWLKETGCHPYVAEVGGAPIGFVFVGDRDFPHRAYDSDFMVVEFWIVPEARRAGVGAALAKMVFAKHPGRWELNVLAKNERALRFWRRLTPGRVEDPEEGLITLLFESRRPRRAR